MEALICPKGFLPLSLFSRPPPPRPAGELWGGEGGNPGLGLGIGIAGACAVSVVTKPAFPTSLHLSLRLLSSEAGGASLRLFCPLVATGGQNQKRAGSPARALAAPGPGEGRDRGRGLRGAGRTPGKGAVESGWPGAASL